jgi:hypothetical protein
MASGSADEETTDDDVTVEKSTASPRWKLYELDVKKTEGALDPDAVLEHNAKVQGIYSKTLRQIDVLARKNVVRRNVQVVFECKRYTKKLGIGKVDEFIGKLVDVGAPFGILYAYSGVSKNAQARADGSVAPQVEIRDLAQTEEILERKRATEYADLSTLLSTMARDWSPEIERTLHSCKSDAGCWGEVTIGAPENEVPSGRCDSCGALHLECVCCGEIFITSGLGGETCYSCGARYHIGYDSGGDQSGIELVAHGEDCDRSHGGPDSVGE